MSVKLLRALLQRPVAFSPILARIAQSATAGLFMSQALYWSERTDHPDGWFYKSRREWYDETMLTRREQETARERWRDLGVLSEHRHGVPPVLHYRVNHDVLLSLVTRYISGEGDERDEAANQNVTSDQLNGHMLPIERSHVTNLYNTETTPESTPETTVTVPPPAPVRGEGLVNKTRGTNVHNYSPFDRRATISPPVWTLMGKKPVSTKGLSAAPDRAIATQETLDWAVGEGWKAGLEELQVSGDTCISYHRGEGHRKADWYEILCNWVRRDIEEGKDLKRAALKQSHGRATSKSLTNVPQENDYGNNGQRVRTGYGYDRAGQPTNKATQLRTTAERLADKQAERERRRRMAGEAGEDAAPFRRYDGGGD